MGSACLKGGLGYLRAVSQKLTVSIADKKQWVILSLQVVGRHGGRGGRVSAAEIACSVVGKSCVQMLD